MLNRYPDKDLKIYNKGISGNKVYQLAERWDADCLDLKPTVLSILVGVNDFWHTLTSGYTGTEAGAALLPLAIILAGLSPLMGKLAGRIGPRLPLSIGPLGVAAGFLLLLRIGEHSNYWTTILPGIVVMALGMAGAVAPLTTAVLSSVDDRYTGAASGFNSAIARSAGLIATASLGSVFAASGAALVGAFHVTVWACAISSAAAAVAAFLFVRVDKSDVKH